MTSRSLLRVAGLLMWAFAGIPTAYGIACDRGGAPAGYLLAWASAFIVFGVTFLRGTATEPTRRMLLVQIAAAATMNVFFCTGFEVALFVVVTVQLGLVLPLREGLAWLAGVTVLAVALALMHMTTRFGVYWSVGVVGFETFAFTVAAMAGREAAARRKIEQMSAELTRASRDGERLRIARELHDLLGHDLIALHLELETARHLTEGPAKERIDRAHDVAKGLLADVRKAVTSLRETPGAMDVADAIRSVLENVQGPRVHLDAPASLAIEDDERANAVVRCVQEIVTNTLKHARAENLWITVTERERDVELVARDDGRGVAEGRVTPGNGLAGMRERIERLGGALAFESKRGEGFHVRATVPR